MELKGSKTEANLAAAFAGESQARNKYDYFAAKAREDGYEQIAAVFNETASNEMAHAKIWFGLLSGIGPTEKNLSVAAEGESYEWSTMYKQMAEDARSEGFDNIAVLFDGVARIEKEHEERYSKLLAALKEDKVFRKDGEVVWICRNCGHIHSGKAAPQVCPICSHPQAYFEVKCS